MPSNPTQMSHDGLGRQGLQLMLSAAERKLWVRVKVELKPKTG